MEELLHKNTIEFAKEFADKKFKEAGTGNHFLDVYRILQNEFEINDEDILIAGLLHDTLEDTNTTYEEIEKTFSKRVADLVEEVSHPKNYTQEQRVEYYERIKHISPEAKMIKMADFKSHLPYFIGVYERNEQHLHPKFVNNDKYVQQIKEFLNTCSDSRAKESTLVLANTLESLL